MLQDIYKQWDDNMLIISRCGSHYENYEIDTEDKISGKTRSKKDSLCKIFLLNNMDTKLL